MVVSPPLNFVAPFVGAWIEMAGIANAASLDYVAPFVGAWIEILTTAYKSV